MSVPPQILRIQRKRKDAPVDALYIENSSKRHRILDNERFVFRRLLPKIFSNSSTHSPSKFTPPSPIVSTLTSVGRKSNGIPQVMATRPGDENALSDRHLRGTVDQQDMTTRNTLTTPRRFHLSNVADLVAGLSYPSAEFPRHGKEPRRANEDGGPIALFVEESGLERPISSNTLERIHNVELTRPPNLNGAQDTMNEYSTPLRKRPGTTATMRTTASVGSSRSVGESNKVECETELQDALQKYAMEEFGVGNKLDDAAHDGDAMDVEYAPQHLAMEMEDADYIYDTYVRQPAHDSGRVTKASASMDTFTGTVVVGPTDSIGYLVIPESSTSTFFYSPDSDDEKGQKEGGWDSEEDDENNENYYAADYPEEEDRDDDGEAWSDDGQDDRLHEYGGNWDWEKRKREWGWDNGVTRKPKAVYSDEEEENDVEDES